MELLWWFAQNRTEFGNTVFGGVTFLGGTAAVIGVVLVLYYCVDKKLAIRIGFSFFVSCLIVQGLKIVMRVPRPWVLDPEFKAVESAIPGASGYSFPSGHTQTVTALAGTLIFTTKKWYIKLVSILLALAVMISRMYHGVHTPDDVLWGLIIAAVVTLIVNLVADRIELTKRNRLIAALGTIAVAIGLTVYCGIIYKNDIIDYANAADIFKICGSAAAFAGCWYVETTYVNFNERGLPVYKHIIKLVVGAAVAFGVKEGFKFILPAGAVGDFVRYFLMVVWALGVFPVIIKRYLNGTETSENGRKAQRARR
ncbi:MAG: phosphatase PAP2 family protein [Lachnospiraceae bacterium]|nr:phosphatase PAP2 family protein [Lachnospiraceae bacterium]